MNHIFYKRKIYIFFYRYISLYSLFFISFFLRYCFCVVLICFSPFSVLSFWRLAHDVCCCVVSLGGFSLCWNHTKRSFHLLQQLFSTIFKPWKQHPCQLCQEKKVSQNLHFRLDSLQRSPPIITQAVTPAPPKFQLHTPPGSSSSPAFLSPTLAK